MSGKPANLWSAVGVAIVSIFVGCLLFEASALAFDYMKLRGMPLYGSAASLGRYADNMSQLVHEMDGDTDTIKQLIRERATIDITVSGKTSLEKDTLTEARNALRKVLTARQTAQTGFDKAGVNFTALDSVFQQVCPDDANAAASNVTASLDAGAAGSTTASPAASEGTKAVAALALTPAQRAAFGPACQIPANYCDGDTPAATAGARARMICAEKTLQDALRRKDAINSFQYDAAVYMTDVMKLTYPDFVKTDVDKAIRVTSNYRAMARKEDRLGCSRAAPSAAAAKPPPCALPDDEAPSVFGPFWDFLLEIPLALLYLALAFMFGGVGSLANYLYATAAPDSLAKTPSEAPWFSVIAGGGAAILTLLVLMAGFQFLTIGASTPDLAYPNPLTVCGLSGIVGLGGDRVLTALRSWIGRFTGGDGGGRTDPKAPETPPVGGPGPTGGAQGAGPQQPVAP